MFSKSGNFRSILMMILSLNIILVKCNPLIPPSIDGSWDENMVDCSPGGRCWELLQKQDSPTKPDYYEDPSRSEIQREQSNPRVIRLPAVNLPSTNRLAKKDVFVSRGWGAGGMPFSVLYLNPHNPRTNSNPGANEIEPARSLPLLSPTPRAHSKHSSNRVTVRNGASNQQRRHYSIIPQLFVSYGWGPLGK